MPISLPHIGIHSFALKHEIHELREQDTGYDENSPFHDPFINEGLSDSEDDPQERMTGAASTSRIPARLQCGKAHREQMKRWLFRAKEHRRQAHVCARRAGLQAELSSTSSNDPEI